MSSGSKIDGSDVTAPFVLLIHLLSLQSPDKHTKVFPTAYALIYYITLQVLIPPPRYVSPFQWLRPTIHL